MKSVYLSGPISSIGKKEAAERFLAVEHTLKRISFYPVNPMAIISNAASWLDFMKVDISAMLLCDCLLMLEGWEDSTGAVIEHNLAESLGIPIYYKLSELVSTQVDDD
jgi:nucleoside 2-deoxyribosyltransferase